MHIRRLSPIATIACALVAISTVVAGGKPEPPQQPPPRELTITFMRHAESFGNVSGFIDTSTPGPELTELGRQQAQQAADTVMPDEYDGVYASTMIRTQQTGEPTARVENEPIEVLAGLREIEAGVYEGQPDKAARPNYLQAPNEWVKGNRAARIPGSIDGNEFDARFDQAVQQIYDSGDTHPIAFSHGAAIMYWTQMNVDNPATALLTEAPLQNTGRVVVTGSPALGWELMTWQAKGP
jgi:broad specificity phosphatase PhoE